jgi:dihydrofolate reductase
MMNAIVVVDENWAIGKDGDLLVHLPGDLKYFREKTLGNTVVYGRKTLESFPGGKPLPGRKNVVLTRNTAFRLPEGSETELSVCHEKEEILEMARDTSAEVFICGGESIYEQFMEYVDTVFVTKIKASFEADKFFPDLDEDGDFEMTWESGLQEENGVAYTFTKYERKNRALGARIISEIRKRQNVSDE